MFDFCGTKTCVNSNISKKEYSVSYYQQLYPVKNLQYKYLEVLNMNHEPSIIPLPTWLDGLKLKSQRNACTCINMVSTKSKSLNCFEKLFDTCKNARQ